MKAQKFSLLPTSMTNKSLTFRQGLVFILSNFKIGWWAGNSIKPIITHPTNIDYLSRLTTQLSGGDSPELQHQRFSSVRSNDLLAERRTDRTPTTPHPQPPERLRTDRSPLATALTDNFLGALATTNNTQTTAATDDFLGALGLTNHLERRV